MGALLPPEHQEESHRQSSAATTKSTLPKQGRDDLEAFSKQTSFLALMLKNVLNHPALFGPGSQRCRDVFSHLATDALLNTGMSRPRELGCGNNVFQPRTTMYSTTRPLMLC